MLDPGHRLADRAGHTGSGALGRGCSPSIATAQADRARELSNEEVTFGVGLRSTLGVSDGARLLDVVVDLGEASAVGVLGRRVEDLARVARVARGTQGRARQGGRLAAVDLPTGGGLGGDEIQHVELAARIGEEPREVAHALEVAHADGLPVEDHRPVVTFPTKDVEDRNRLLACVVMLDLSRWGHRRRGFDSIESWGFLRNTQAVKDTIALLASNPNPVEAEAYDRQARAYLDFDARDRLGGITAPTLVVVGEQDLLTPPWVAREVAGGIPGALLEIVTGDGSSHLLPLERPDDFNQLVMGFLSD
ncbi:MAG TPA: hypothetical protein VFD31_12075 [Thermoleophilaceae bacterium]|nr:hypothetical protein [Thermoleophilaceae bacterium]